MNDLLVKLDDEAIGAVAYEAYRRELSDISTVHGPWAGLPDWHKQAWIAAGKAARTA